MTNENPIPKNTTTALIGKAFIALIVSYAVIFLAAIWGNLMDAAWFWKLSITYAVILVVLAAIYLIRREFESDDKMRNDKYMD